MKPQGLIALDEFALSYARNHPIHRLRCDYTIDELPVTTPVLSDITPLQRPQGIPGGGTTYGVTLQQLQTLIGGGGGVPSILFNTNLSALTIYNYGNYVTTPSGNAAANTAALQTMFTAMANGPGNGGGYAWIPQYQFPVNASSGGMTVPDNAILLGLGTGGKSGGGSQYHFVISDTGGGGQTFWALSGPHNSGGIQLLNLAFEWSSPSSVLDTCLNLDTWNAKVRDCNFVNVPIVANIGAFTNGNSLNCTLEQCTIQYNGANNATAILLGGEQAAIIGPSEMFQTGIGNSGPTHCCCISIGGNLNGSEHQQIVGLHLSEWSYAIDYADINNTGIGSGCQYTTVRDNEINAWATAVNMTTVNNTSEIYGQHYSGNTMFKSQDSTDGSPLVYIDTNGGPNGNVASLDFIGNLLFSNVASNGGSTGIAQNNQYGIQINAGQAIRIIGGKISNFGTKAGTDGTANICISGDPLSVIINAVDLRPKFSRIGNNGATGSAASQYGILISGALTNGGIRVSNCDLTGFTNSGQAAIGVTGSVASGTFIVTDCFGYNDQNTAINVVANIGTSAQAAYNQGANSGTSYFGPSYVFYTANASGGTLKVNGGAALSLANGQTGFFFLNSPYDSFQFSLAPASCQWLGK